MSILPLDQLTPGMVVANNVCDAGGRILLARSSAITERHLRIFKTWGVTEVDVATGHGPAQNAPGDGEGGSQPTFPKSMEPYCKKAEALFHNSDMSHPAVQQLFAVCVNRLSMEKPEEKKRVR